VSTELRISSIPPFFKCPRVRPCECGCIHEDSLLPIPPGGLNFSADGVLVDGCLAVFPWLKGRKNIHLYPSFQTMEWRLLLIVAEYDCSSAMQGYSANRLKRFHLAVFVFLSQGSFKIACRTNADQACFCTSQLCLGETIINFRNI
jgi:hypothetical protein